MSSVIKIYKMFNEGSWGTGRFTWEKNSHAARALWALLITSGFEFAIDDLIERGKLWKKAGRYGDRCDGPGEQHYTLAVRSGNLTFAYAYEKLVGRVPFIGTSLDYDYTAKTQGRVVEDCEFMWEGETVKVTTFRDDEHALIACAYHPQDDDDYSRRRIKRRFKITHDMWAAANRLQKKVDKLKTEGVSIDFKAGWGYAISDRRNRKNPVFYDSTGEVEGGQKMDTYKPFKTLAKAYDAAVLLKEVKP